jgi:SNF2 family DNA or RNA helicase
MKKANYHLQQTLLNSIIHRKGPDVLQADLPPRHEYIFKVKLTAYQQEIYKKIIDAKRDKDDRNFTTFLLFSYFLAEKFNDYLFSLVDILKKICNHTDLIRDESTRSDLNEEYELLLLLR